MVTTWVHDVDQERGFAHLDVQRLNAQRGGEGLIVARATMARLRGEYRGWQQHPAVVMWTGRERALMAYQIRACREWRRRGYEDFCLGEYLAYWEQLPVTTAALPDWWGVHSIHRTHRLWLLIRRPDLYEGRPGFDDPDEMEEARLWRKEHGEKPEEEPPLTWPVSGVTTSGEGSSPLSRPRASA